MREVREECGRGFHITGMIGEAMQYVDAGDEGCFENHSTFYRGQFEDQVPVANHTHDVLWLAPREAARRLHHRSHAWAVDTALGMIRPQQ